MLQKSTLFSKTHLQTLRSRADEALGFKKAGRNPWLACSVIPTGPVDPQFVLVVNRVCLLRQVLAFEPVDQLLRRLFRTSEFPSLVTCFMTCGKLVGNVMLSLVAQTVTAEVFTLLVQT